MVVEYEYATYALHGRHDGPRCGCLHVIELHCVPNPTVERGGIRKTRVDYDQLQHLLLVLLLLLLALVALVLLVLLVLLLLTPNAGIVNSCCWCHRSAASVLIDGVVDSASSSTVAIGCSCGYCFCEGERIGLSEQQRHDAVDIERIVTAKSNLDSLQRWSCCDRVLYCMQHTHTHTHKSECSHSI